MPWWQGRRQQEGAVSVLTICCLSVYIGCRSSDATTCWQTLQIPKRLWNIEHHVPEQMRAKTEMSRIWMSRMLGLSHKCQEGKRVIGLDSKWYKWKMFLLRDALNVKCTCVIYLDLIWDHVCESTVWMHIVDVRSKCAPTVPFPLWPYLDDGAEQGTCTDCGLSITKPSVLQSSILL